MKVDKKLFQLVLTPPLYSLQEQLDIHKLQLSKIIVDKVTYAIDNDIEEIDVAEIVAPFDMIILKSSRRYFTETLEHNKENLLEHEEYEYCAICQKYLEILKNKK